MVSAPMSLWRVGAPEDTEAPAGAGNSPRAGSVALTAPMPPGQPGVWFHEAMSADYGRAPRVQVWLPAYRGKSLVPLLGWLVAARLASPDAEVTWWLEKRQGPDSVARMLTELGWRQITRERDGSASPGCRP